jgi:transposase
MSKDAHSTKLPDDLAQCHALIDELLSSLRQQELEKARLLARVQHLLRQMYGRSAEKIDPAQLLLFAAEAMAAVEAEAPQTEVLEPEPEAAPKKKGHGRKKPPVELPHLPIEYPVPESEKVCAECGTQKKRIGQKVTEQLEYAPSSLFVIDHIQPVFACPCCQEGVTVAPKPAQPIAKGLPGPGLLAQVVVSKYADHLPLHRQEDIFGRHGVELSRKTMCDWVLASAKILEPVVELMKARTLDSKVIHTDDTPVNVRGPGGNYQGRFWVYVGDGHHPYTVYDFTPSRRRDGPAAFLDGFAGTKEDPRYLQADAFGGYDGIYAAEASVFEVACWAHTRRKFYDARSSDVNRAHQVLAWVRMLYDVERDAKGFDAQQRRDLRLERSKPVLDKMQQWLDSQQGRVLPKSPIGEAVTYAQNQWKALLRYLDDGDLAIDNNAAENALRGIAIGRKNFLFLGSDRGGRAAATLYSLVRSAKRHELDPFIYLRDLFLRIPTHPNRDIHLLLPDHWKRDILPTLDSPPRP